MTPSGCFILRYSFVLPFALLCGTAGMAAVLGFAPSFAGLFGPSLDPVSFFLEFFVG
jgi:hypothetical protein